VILQSKLEGRYKGGETRCEDADFRLRYIFDLRVCHQCCIGPLVWVYTTNFGVKLTSTGNSRTLMAFIGFRRCNPNKTVEVLMDGWQVNGLCIRYHRENKKEKTANTLAIRKRKAQGRALLEQEA